MRVLAEFVDNSKEFKWRLVKGKEKSKWYKHYEGILTYRFKDGELWGLVTCYWDGTLPSEKPFQIIENRFEDVTYIREDKTKKND